MLRTNLAGTKTNVLLACLYPVIVAVYCGIASLEWLSPHTFACISRKKHSEVNASRRLAGAYVDSSNTTTLELSSCDLEGHSGQGEEEATAERFRGAVGEPQLRRAEEPVRYL